MIQIVLCDQLQKLIYLYNAALRGRTIICLLPKVLL